MTKFTLGRRALMAAAAATLSFAAPVFADGHQVVEKIHFLIPGGAGGGWDGTARGTGEALTKAGLVGSASYENMSGGGGGKAIADLDTLHGVDRHQIGGDVAVELGVDRRAEAAGHALGDDLDDGADRRAALAHRVQMLGPAFGGLGVGGFLLASRRKSPYDLDDDEN